MSFLEEADLLVPLRFTKKCDMFRADLGLKVSWSRFYSMMISSKF
jgi:hypothetical protein